jgi:hypothetical protein
MSSLLHQPWAAALVYGLLFTQATAQNSTSQNTTGSAQAFFQQVVPQCAQSCLTYSISQDYNTTCSDQTNISCLCTHYGTDGYALGELALFCVYSSVYSSTCGADVTQNPTPIYEICSNVSNAVQPTHKKLTGVPNGLTGNPSGASPTPSPSATPGGKKLSTTEVAAIVIALVALLVVCVTVGIIFWLRSKRRARSRDDEDAATLVLTPSHDSLVTVDNHGGKEKQFEANETARPKSQRKSRLSFIGFGKKNGEGRSWPKYYRISPPPSFGLANLALFGNNDANTASTVATATRRSGITDPNAKRAKPLITLQPSKSQHARATRISGFTNGRTTPTPKLPPTPSFPTKQTDLLTPLGPLSTAKPSPSANRGLSPTPQARSTSPLPKAHAFLPASSPLLKPSDFMATNQPVMMKPAFSTSSPMVAGTGLSLQIPHTEDEITAMRALTPGRLEINRSVSPLPARSVTPGSLRSGTPASTRRKNLVSQISEAASGSNEGLVRPASPEILHDTTYQFVSTSPTQQAQDNSRAAYMKRARGNGRTTPVNGSGRKSPHPQTGRLPPIGFKSTAPAPVAVETDGTQMKQKLPLTPMSDVSSASGLYPRVPSGLSRNLQARGSNAQKAPPAAYKGVVQARAQAIASAQASSSQSKGKNIKSWESQTSGSVYKPELPTPSSKYSQSTAGRPAHVRRHTASGSVGFAADPETSYSPAYHFSRHPDQQAARRSEEHPRSDGGGFF